MCPYPQRGTPRGLLILAYHAPQPHQNEEISHLLFQCDEPKVSLLKCFIFRSIGYHQDECLYASFLESSMLRNHLGRFLRGGDAPKAWNAARDACLSVTL